MVETRIQISSVVEGQLPEFVREEFPLVAEFLKQYYLSLESQGGTTDILQNIDQYVKVDNITNLTESTILGADITPFDSTINVSSTYGFADRYGLIKINDEIITYTGKTLTSFTGCVRGFSGVTSYQSKNNSDQLVFTESNSSDHISGSIVENLSILFLKEFFKKVKKQITPGFQDREFYSGLNERLFVKQAKDFYSTKGTNTSFEILFRALYGQDVEVIKPRDYLIQPSDAQYRISKNLIVEALEGDPLELENATLYQDPTDFFSKARGTVIHAEKIKRGDKDYYALNLDYNPPRDINLEGTVLGKFSIHPKTQTTTSVSINSTVLDVDSTIGFPNSGTLIAKLSNGTTVSIGYSSKTITQFFNCTNINQEIPAGQEIALDAYAYGHSGIGTSNVIKVRVTGVLSDLEIESQNKNYNKGDIVKIRTLGKDLGDYRSNNWFFNISTRFDVSGITTSNLNNSYVVNLYDEHKFSIGDSITLISSDGAEKTGNIIFINDKTSFTIQGQGKLSTSLYYTARKNILKANAENYPSLKVYDTNVQNVYTDLKNSLYIAAPSIPTYLNQSLKINDRSVAFSGTFDGTELNLGKSHGFYTGDSVVYTGDVIPHGIYFVKKITDNTIKIAKSKANIDTGNFVSVSGTIGSGKFNFTDFCYENLDVELLEPQKLVRKLTDPENDGNVYETKPGLTGIFANGVELLNYKSKDNVYYGPIENITPTAPGFGYDIINPPILTIYDSVGTGASAYCSVVGGLERIDIIDPGFDYLEEPVITITGGNGTGAVAKTKLVSFDYSIDFNSQENAGLVNLTDNTIGFSSYHKFKDVEEVIYNTNGGTAIAGLTTNSSYFISLQDAYTVKLYKSFKDASSKINPIDLTSYGTGNHTLKSKVKKKKVGSIAVENSGINYQNKKTTVTSVGIDTTADIINIKNHGYKSGEIISYTPSSTPIGGLTASSSYYITSLNEDQFKLSHVSTVYSGIITPLIKVTYGGYPVRGYLYYPTSPNVKSSLDVVVLMHGTIEKGGVSPYDAASKFIDIALNQINIKDKIIFSVAYPQDEIPLWNANPTLPAQQFPGLDYPNFYLGDNVPYVEAALLWVQNNLNTYLSNQGIPKTINKVFTFGHSQGAYLAHRLNTMHAVSGGVISNAPGPIDLLTVCSYSESHNDVTLTCKKIKTGIGDTTTNPNAYITRSLKNYLSGTLSPTLFTQALDDPGTAGGPQVSNMQNIVQPGLSTCTNCAPVTFNYYETGGHDAFVHNADLQQDIRNFVGSTASGSFNAGAGKASNFYYQTKQYVDLTSTGNGTHTFNYPPINVDINGRIGVSIINPQNFNAVLQPIFRGKIESVFIENGGSSYGSEEIINYNKQPQFLLNSGSGAQVTPVISNGKIVDILINSTGGSYNSPPTLLIDGDGQGAILTPILSNGALISVNIISGGGGYTSGKTFITVFAAGEGANFLSQAKSWKINLVQRLIANKQITDDDGILDNGINNSLGLEYTHAYAPRSLRKSVFASKLKDGSLVYTKDLEYTTKEEDSTAHSPIIGWAYDGNPIYGPYGYSSITGGTVKSMVSGYNQSLTNPYRPSTSLYPSGFFVEDYEYQNVGDLDEFNGRFCVTPEYPNGVYAYFCTIGNVVAQFNNYKIPVFPYVIGNYFKSKPIEFNFLTSSNQDNFDFKSFKLLRNTTPYNLNKQRSGYDYLLNPNKIKNQLSEVENTTTGSVESVGIITGGDGYQVGDQIILDSENNLVKKAFAKVSLVSGKEISNISVATSTISNVEFIPTGNINNFIGFATLPHNFLNNDLVTITTPYENKKLSNISIKTNNLILSSGIGSAAYTGIITYFNVSGSLNYPNIIENDVYQIQDEQIKVLNIDTLNSRIRVIRNYNGTSGLTTYVAGTKIAEIPRKFELNFGISSTSYKYNLDREFYFNPKESVGLGTTAGVGIVSTIYFSNPGAGRTNITIPTQSIYLPEHKLNTGDSLIYSSNDGTTLSVSTNGVSSFTLLDKSIVYASKISNDLIGISTSRVKQGNSLKGLLYFTGIGTGVYHRFTTKNQNTLLGQISKNVVTVLTSSNTGLTAGDSVIVDIKPGISTTVVVKYNDYNRRLIINPKSFVSGNVDILTDTITINNHGYRQGQKIIHTSSSPSGGLINEKIYYIVVIDSNNIKLSETLYSTKKTIPDVVNITSASYGTISQINPPLNLIKNQTVIFDVSDSSLSFLQNSNSYSAFNLNFYTDSKFKNRFNSSSTTSSFEVTQIGTVGISSNAQVILSVNENIPQNLYYKLEPINLQNNTSLKKEIIIDDEQVNFNQLSIVDSGYNGNYRVIAISTNSFDYNLAYSPEKSSYSPSEGTLNYYTNSPFVYGGISSISIFSKDSSYISLPKIDSIITNNGKNSILFLNSTSIGNINKKQILDIGFDYSSDYTVRPIAKLPTIAKIDPLYSFESINVTSFGKNYNTSPNLVVLDGLTNKIVSDVILKYQLGNSQVDILQNTKGLNNVPPKIIPINNSNGVGISSITFDSLTKNVTVTLSVGYSTSTSFPFVVGDRVLIENVSVGVGSIGKGYNSDRYNYALFTLTSIDPNIGGNNGTVVYNMSDYLGNGEVPGTYDPINSVGRIIPEKYFPIFNSVLKQNIFYNGETISSNSSESKGIVQKLNENSEYLKIVTSDTFNIGDNIEGNTSFTQGKIIKILSSAECIYDVEASSIVKNGWNRETGFLSNNLQRIHDSDYYQYFSYAVKSEIPFDTWKDPVNDLNHTAGFKKFSDLIIESKSETFSGIITSQNGGDFIGIADLSRFVDLNCVNDFDLVKELTINVDNDIKSNEIIFNSATLQDYIESIGNRVLTIDDVSEKFNSNPRLTPFSVVDTFRLNTARSKKYLIYVTDDTFVAERQVSLLTLLYNNSYGFLNQYGVTPTVYGMGFFDFLITGDNGNILFYPTKSEVNNFTINYVSYDMQDILSEVGTISLGNVVRVGSSSTSLSAGISTATTIVGIASTYRASKVLVQIGATNSSYYQYDELTVIHDGTTANLLEYGQLNTSTLSPTYSTGLGTYNAYLSGSKLNIDFTPNSPLSVQYNINTTQISISNNSSVGVGSVILESNKLSSNYVSIASSTSPNANIVATYDNQTYSCAYYIVSIEDSTNNNYQVSEVLVVDNKNNSPSFASTDAFISEFGIIQTNTSLGTITANVLGNNTNLYFTPIAGINTKVRIFQHSLGFSNLDITDTSIEF